jgi:hypothetical protein
MTPIFRAKHIIGGIYSVDPISIMYIIHHQEKALLKWSQLSNQQWIQSTSTIHTEWSVAESVLEEH